MAEQRGRLEPAARRLERRPSVPILGMADTLVAVLWLCPWPCPRYPGLLSWGAASWARTALSTPGHARRPGARAFRAGDRACVARSRAADLGVPGCHRVAGGPRRGAARVHAYPAGRAGLDRTRNWVYGRGGAMARRVRPGGRFQGTLRARARPLSQLPGRPEPRLCRVPPRSWTVDAAQ